MRNPVEANVEICAGQFEKFGVNGAVGELQLIALRNSGVVQECVRGATTMVDMWFDIPEDEKYADIRRCGLRLLAMFGSTYHCESSFSTLNYIKNKYRSRLTNANVQNMMRLALTGLKPRFVKLTKAKPGQVSH